jgi:amino acid adenylation domain-containing protein
MQQGMVFHTLHDRQGGTYVQQLLATLTGPLDPAAFARAWDRVCRRHAVLRTTFHADGDEPRQRVHHAIDLPFAAHDWRPLPPAEQASRLQAFLADDRARGFDLARPPLQRVNLFRLADDRHRLVWTYHHALLDGRSRLLVLKELFAFAAAFARGEGLDLPTPRPFRDYIDWLGGRDWSAAEAYWKAALAGLSAPTGLPAGRPASAALPTGQRTRELRLPAAVTAGLEAFAREHGLTLNTLIQAAWALLLSRYTGEADVVFGATRACRHSVEGSDAMVGVFINTLPLRVRVAGHLPLLPWLRQLRDSWQSLRDHEHSPATRIRQWCGWKGSLPLFETFVVFEKHRVVDAGIPGAGDFQLLERSNYPLGLAAYGGEELLLRLEHDAGRYADDAIGRMLGHLRLLLEGMMAAPAGRLSELARLTPEEQELLDRQNRTAAAFPDRLCAHELFEAQAARTPDAVAVVCGGRQMTFRELNGRANEMASRLRRKGVGPETLVGLFLRRSPEMVVGILGVLKAGGAYVPLDPSYPRDRLTYMLRDARAALLLTQRALLASVPDYAGPVLCLDGGSALDLREARDDRPCAATPDGLAYVIYTSGSTGKPKGILITHRGLVNYLSWAVQAYCVAEGAGAPVQSSISFDLTVTSLFTPLLTGRAVHLVPEEQGLDGLTEALRNGRDFSLVKITPAHLELLGQQLSPAEAAGRTRAFIIGGENLTSEHVAFWRRHAPATALVNEYGPTETVVGCCVHTVCAADDASGSIPIGRPIANTQLYVLDEDLRPVPVGAVGELHIGGAGVARGYHRRPELTAEKFVPDPFGGEPGARLYRTGDLARYRPDGTLEFLGRIDHQVKVRGYRIELGEIEVELAEHPSVREVAVVARPGADGEKALVAYVVLRPGEAVLTTPQMREFLKEKLPAYMIPAAVVALEALPLTANGKLDREALPAPDLVSADDAADSLAPRNERERRMVRLWEEVLRTAPIGVRDDFFARGGHSLLAARLFVRIEQEFGQKLPLSALLDEPTVEHLVRLLEERQPRRPPVLVALQPRGHRPPFYCVHAVGGEVLTYKALAQHFPADQPFYGVQLPHWDWADRPFPEIEEMAARYVEEVRALQQAGPYFLGGYSSGGTVALAMARQLWARGEEVGMLAILDHRPFNLQPARPWHPRPVGHFLINVWHWLRADGKRLGLRPVLRRLPAKLGRLGRRVAASAVGKPCPQLDISDVFDVSGLAAASQAFLRGHMQALQRHVPGSYPGPVTLFRSRARPLFRLEGHDLGWGQIAAGGVEVIVLPGSHDTLVQEPSVRLLAERLAERLRRAQENERSEGQCDEHFGRRAVVQGGG